MRETHRLHRSLIGLAAILAAFSPALSYAKVKYENSAKLHWNAVDKAKSYQIQVLAGDKVILEQDVVGTSYTAILPAGKLGYRLRTVDQTGRPGSWSRTREFTILPGPPVAADTQESELPYKGIPLDTTLKWEAADDATSYVLRVWKADQVVLEKAVSGISAGFQVPAAGHYKYALASVHHDLTGGFGPAFEFSAIEFKLSAAKELYPTGRIAIQEGGKIRLKWSEVKGAEAYEVELIPQKKWKMQATVESDSESESDSHKWKTQFQIEGAEADATAVEDSTRKPAGQTVAKPVQESVIGEPKKFTTQDNSLVIPVPSEGSYTWRVRALAGMNEQKKAGAQGPSAEAELETFRRSGD